MWNNCVPPAVQRYLNYLSHTPNTIQISFMPALSCNSQYHRQICRRSRKSSYVVFTSCLPAISREYEFITEAHAQLFVVWNCYRYLSVCALGKGEQLAGRERSAVSGAGGGADNTQGERIWSSLGRQKVKRGLLLIIHFLCLYLLNDLSALTITLDPIVCTVLCILPCWPCLFFQYNW